MAGFIYRLAIDIKDLGERRKWAWLVRIGYCLREAAYRGKAK